jgi:hypothetical protein
VPTNALLADATGQIMILDDDPLPAVGFLSPTIFLTELPAAVTNAEFTVSLSVPSGRTVNVKFATMADTARSGADFVANETLFEDKPARLFRRASRAPRPISVSHSLPPKNADMQVWVTVPAEKINEHHVMQAVRFEAGEQKRLVIRYDAASKKFTYDLN